MYRRKAVLITGVLLCSVFLPRESEARLFRRLFGGGRSHVVWHQPPVHHPPHHSSHHPEPEGFDSLDFEDNGFDSVDDFQTVSAFSQARPFYFSLRNQLMLLGEEGSSVGLKGRCFDGSHWSSTNVINLNVSHGRLRIGHNDFQITFLANGWIRFSRRGHWGWEQHLLRNIGNGSFQYFRRSNGGNLLRCTLNSISEISGQLPISSFFSGLPAPNQALDPGGVNPGVNPGLNPGLNPRINPGGVINPAANPPDVAPTSNPGALGAGPLALFPVGTAGRTSSPITLPMP